MIIYITTCLINNKKYLGKDSKNNPNYYGSGTLFLEDFQKFGKENFKKEIIEYCKTPEELREREIYWIDYYDAVRSDEFYNLVRSSGGWDHNLLSEEKYKYICNKISQGSKGVKKPKLSLNESRKEKLRKANGGKPKPKGFGERISKIKQDNPTIFTPEHCKKITEGKLGKKQPLSFSEKKYKPVEQLTKNLKLVNEFKSIEDAKNSNPRFKRSNISCCLIGVSKTAYGFIWRYKDKSRQSKQIH